MDGLAGQASLTSVTEYLLTQPILSFIISGHTPCPAANGGGESEEEGEEEEEAELQRVVGGSPMLPRRTDSRLTTVLIKLHCIHTRSE